MLVRLTIAPSKGGAIVCGAGWPYLGVTLVKPVHVIDRFVSFPSLTPLFNLSLSPFTLISTRLLVLTEWKSKEDLNTWLASPLCLEVSERYATMRQWNSGTMGQWVGGLHWCDTAMASAAVS